MFPSRLVAAIVVTVVLAAIAVIALGSRPTIAALDQRPGKPDPALVRMGAELAAIGDCLVCHTAPGGKPYAGGRALDTPFGTIYGTNITPDPDSGIGRWSQAAFVRAMREGVDRDGRHLYPAFPYDHFRHVSDADLAALYAYLMSRDPVRAETPANRLVFPLNFRPLIAFWKMLYLRDSTFAADPGRDREWNRGAYLVSGLGHCGACHTPRNRLGAERADQAFAGGEAEGWHAPALNGASPTPVRWTADALFTYLRTGIAPEHGVSAGPMAPVTHNLSTVPEDDVRAIAAYVASFATGAAAPATASPARSDAAASTNAAAGRALYESACASCHETAREAFFRGALDLRKSTALQMPTAANLANIIIAGIVPADGDAGAWMPSFHGALTDGQVQALIDYLRTGMAGRPAWNDVASEVRRAREATARSANASTKDQRS